jgi:hypothetical protein
MAVTEQVIRAMGTFESTAKRATQHSFDAELPSMDLHHTSNLRGRDELAHTIRSSPRIRWMDNSILCMIVTYLDQLVVRISNHLEQLENETRGSIND